ncbi:MAG: phosphohistidine phosphatase SixA [Halobacteriovoraceae bacterium]|nr:phosphohistidine phosphatase SixA [Halobacteriovoraceae bacterium]
MSKILLIRHGEAGQKIPDHLRELTSHGRESMLTLAHKMKRLNFSPEFVLHSNFIRAQQSAEIFAKNAFPKARIEVRDNLHPSASVEQWSEYIQCLDTDCVIVSHNPFLSNLVYELCHDTTFVGLKTSDAVMIETSSDGPKIIYRSQ